MSLAKEFEGQLWVRAADHQAELTQQAAVIEQMREAMKEAVAESDQMLCDNSGHNCEENYSRCNSSVRRVLGKALALQPCPEVLNKVRADAVRKFTRTLCLYGTIVDEYIKAVEKEKTE